MAAANLKPHARAILVLLVVQYLLGMAANLFVAFPQGAHDGQLWEFAWKQLPIAAHIIVAIALLISALALLVRSIRAHDKNWKIASGVGFGTILLAGVAGSSFIPTQTAGYSYLMAVCFLIALFAYGWGLTRPQGRAG